MNAQIGIAVMFWFCTLLKTISEINLSSIEELKGTVAVKLVSSIPSLFGSLRHEI